MIISIDERGFGVTETTCLGCFDYRKSPDNPWPPSGGNRFNIRYMDGDGRFHYVTCMNARYENFEVLARLYPDLELTVNELHMRITDPRVGPEWLCER